MFPTIHLEEQFKKGLNDMLNKLEESFEEIVKHQSDEHIKKMVETTSRFAKEKIDIALKPILKRLADLEKRIK